MKHKLQCSFSQIIAYSRPDVSYVICSMPYHRLNWVGCSSCWPTSLPVFSIDLSPYSVSSFFLPNFPFHVVIFKVARIKKEKGGIFILSRLFPPLSLPVLRLPRWLHVHGMTYFCFKVWLNGQQKRETCFATYCSNTC